MEYFDIVLNGFTKLNIDDFVMHELKICSETIIDSHFYTCNQGDFKFNNKIMLSEYFSEKNRNCNFFLNKLELIKSLKNVVVVIEADANDIDLTINFETIQITKNDVNAFINYFVYVQKKYNLKKIYLSDENSYSDSAYILINSDGERIINKFC